MAANSGKAETIDIKKEKVYDRPRGREYRWCGFVSADLSPLETGMSTQF